MRIEVVTTGPFCGLPLGIGRVGLRTFGLTGQVARYVAAGILGAIALKLGEEVMALAQGAFGL